MQVSLGTIRKKCIKCKLWLAMAKKFCRIGLTFVFPLANHVHRPEAGSSSSQCFDLIFDDLQLSIVSLHIWNRDRLSKTYGNGFGQN